MSRFTSLAGIILCYSYPIFLCIGTLISRLLQHRVPDEKGEPLYQRVYRGNTSYLYGLQAILCATFFNSCVLCTILAVRQQSGNHGLFEAYLASNIILFLFFAAALLPEPDKSYQPAFSDLCAWVFAFVLEASLVIAFSMHNGDTYAELSQIAVPSSISRVAILLLIVVWFLLNWQQRSTIRDAEEQQDLLSNLEASEGYGAVSSRHVPAKNLLESKSSPRRGPVAPNPGWVDYFYGFKRLFYYVWPRESRSQQATVSVCILLLVTQRIVNIMVPYQLGVLVEALGAGHLPWKEIALYIFYSSLQGQNGVLASIRLLIWIPVSQSVFRNITCAAFDHLLGLSLDFHLNKRIGEIISALGKGSALSTFLDAFAFQMFPMVFDIFLAAAFLFIKFDTYYSLIVAVVLWSYVSSTMYIAKYRGQIRRQMADRNRQMEAVRTDAIISYETVHYNDATSKEADRFRLAIQHFQEAETPVLLSLSGLNVVQSVVFTFGIVMIVILSAYQISKNRQKVGVFISIVTYMTQLKAPLEYFGTFFNHIQNNLIDAERMLELVGSPSPIKLRALTQRSTQFTHQPQITDKFNACRLPRLKGDVEFHNVTFSYQGQRSALKDVSFRVPTNTHTALVGDSGGGKSTCLKLLFRFYDVSSGSIRVDGNDIRDVTQSSLRSQIGVVPQDTILFNETILYNLLYANSEANMEEVTAACKEANIHDRIIGFPKGYETIVGERGLRLSGGEKQRVAIARALLRNPRIMLLDEATSSLDSQTERGIQRALVSAAKERTTITIAHRLSTITGANQILVLREGSIVERGTHESLLALGKTYYRMWQKQTLHGDDEDLRPFEES